MYRTIVPVSVEPLTIAEVKLHLRLPDETIEHDLLQGLITAAREYCEEYTRRAISEQTLELMLDLFPGSEIVLPRPPLQSVLSIKLKDTDGAETTIANTNYLVDADSDNGRIVLAPGAVWPVFEPYPANPIRIQFIAGYTSIPQTIKQAMLLLVGHWYENREATGTASGLVAFSVQALLSVYRVEWF